MTNRSKPSMKIRLLQAYILAFTSLSSFGARITSDFVGRGLTDIPHSDSNMDRPNTYTVKLSFNELWLIGEFEFSGYSSLTLLYLDHNKITEVWSTAFLVPNLYLLDLSYNLLTTVPQIFLHASPKPNIQVLKLGFNELTVIGEFELSSHPSLTQLYLNNNKITTVDSTAFLGTSLYLLELSSNLLTALNLIDVGGLKYLYLGNNKFTLFPNLKFVEHSLQSFRINDNQITQIPYSYIEGLQHVVQFDITRNPLKKWPDFSGLVSLTKLDLGDITTLPRVVDPSVCRIQEIDWHVWTATPRYLPIFHCNDPDTTNNLAQIRISFDNSVPAKFDFFGSDGLEDSLELLFIGYVFDQRKVCSNYNADFCGPNSFLPFPGLPMEVRTSSKFKIMWIGGTVTEMDPDYLVGYQLDVHAINKISMTNIPCELFNTSKILNLGYGSSSSVLTKAALYRKCLCQRESLILERLMLMIHPFFLPDLSSILCKSSTPFLFDQWWSSVARCDCASQWMADVLACNVSVQSSEGRLACTYMEGQWPEFTAAMNCPTDFVVFYLGVDFPSDWFVSDGIMVSSATSLTSIPIQFSIAVRGTQVWKVSSSTGEVHLRPGDSYERINLITEPTSIEPMTKSDIILPPDAVAVPNPSPCAAPPLSYGTDLLGDADFDSCYVVSNKKQEFVIMHKQPSGQGRVNVTTRDMDCRNDFFIQVYVNHRDAVETCVISDVIDPVNCPVESGEALWEGLTACTFVCDCSGGQCKMDDKWIIAASHYHSGYLCEVAVYLDW